MKVRRDDVYYDVPYTKMYEEFLTHILKLGLGQDDVFWTKFKDLVYVLVCRLRVKTSSFLTNNTELKSKEDTSSLLKVNYY